MGTSRHKPANSFSLKGYNEKLMGTLAQGEGICGVGFGGDMNNSHSIIQ